MAPEMQVKQYVAVVRGEHGFHFRVFTTGSDRHYLFCCIENPDLQVPVVKAELHRDVRIALSRGWGNAHENDARPRPCGTDAAYKRHLRHREPTDQACKDAHADEEFLRQERRREAGRR